MHKGVILSTIKYFGGLLNLRSRQKKTFSKTAVSFFFLTIVFCLFHITSYGQKDKIDSLRLILKTAKEDTTKVNLLNKLSKELSLGSIYDTSFIYAENAKELAYRLNYKSGIALSYLNIGRVYHKRGKYQEALKNYFESLKRSDEIHDKNGIAASYTSIGNLYNDQGNYPEALSSHLNSFKIREAIGDKLGISVSTNNIGNVYYSTGNYPEALKNYFISLKIREEMGDKHGVALSLNNIGNIYSFQGNYEMALKNFFVGLKIENEIGSKYEIAMFYNNIGVAYFGQGKYSDALQNHLASLSLREELMDKRGIAESYNNIANVNCKQNSYSEALKNYEISLKIREEIGDKRGLTICYGNIGFVYITLGNTEEAEAWFGKALQLSKKIGYKDLIKNSYQGLAEADSTFASNVNSPLKIRLQYSMSALSNYKMYVLYKDSLINEETIKKSERERNQYEFSKKEAIAKAEQKQKDALAKAEQKKQQIILWSVLLVLLLVLLLAGFIFRSLRNTKKQKLVIENQKDILVLQNKEIEKQKKIVEEKNKDITDSINYAKRIQQARLPDIKEIESVFPNSFVLFKPKDIVSGDFYYFHSKPVSSNQQKNVLDGGGDIFIAAADCTGHGVPGAFVSMIGSEKLDEALIHSSDTSQILSLLNRGVKKSLHQTSEDGATRDGMDIALCHITLSPSINKERKWIIRYAGANRPLWIIRKNAEEVNEIKATKKAIGGLTEDDQYFDTHEIILNEGDTFYISTDGYADTFGGDGQKKIMTKQFKEILLKIQNKTMKEQGVYLNDFVEKWKMDTEQMDDILVIGVKF